MQKSLLLSGVVIGAVIAIGAVVFFIQSESPQEMEEVTGEPAVTIVRTNSGYEPNEVTVKKGDIILWKNESSDFHWPASDIHPTHTIYPAFDPLRAIAPGEDWKFKFEKVGTWKFHDHIRANKTGVITVTE